MSGQVDEPFGGHRTFAVAVAALYGLLHTASVWTELSYSYDQYEALIWRSSVLAFVLASLGCVFALWLAARGAVRGDNRALGAAAMTFGAFLLAITVAMCESLPRVPTIEANFATRSAATGFLKNELLYFVPLLLFMLPTFHAVVALQTQLRAGRFRAVLELLTGSRESVAPAGAWLIPNWLLVLMLLAAAVIGYTGTNNLLDNLKPGAYADTFGAVLYLRVFLWCAIAIACLVWYHRSFQELKREAVAASRLKRGD